VPELPEVETVRRAIAPVLAGTTILRASISDARLTRPFDPALVAAELEGERVAAVGRRGKYLLVELAGGRVLVVHLRMTGSFRIASRDQLGDDAHRRAVLSLDNGFDVGYRDVRRFGTWELLEPGDIGPYLDERLGPEPLDPALTRRRLGALLEGRRAPVKAFLLDQRRLAGLGNIYADEALWYARLHPRRPAGSLDPDEIARLHRSLRHVLRLGVARQGATLRDYAAPDGSSGGMQDEFRAYGRAGQPCDRCGVPLERIAVAGRGTTFCPRCQPGPATGDAA
jgi:formamidopyrimidine-DNA glycosylase